MESRQQWGTRAGFIMAAVGSAIGLGNIWRFPYTAYDNGGGAFFLPYLFALLTTGISLLSLEFIIGQRYRGSAPLTWSRIHPKLEFLGWWQVFIPFVISTFYAVIIAWSLSYGVFSLNLSWGQDTETFLFSNYLQLTETPGELGGLVLQVVVPLLIVWAVVLGVLFKGIKKGIETINRIFIPLLVIMFSIIVVRAVTLPGAAAGLDALFRPDWSSLTNPQVWAAAYGQIFFSLSIGCGIMITYSSYLPQKSDTTNNAFIAAFSNSGFELLAGIGVFSALGFMANNAGVGVDEVASGGIGLAFVVFPQIINQLPFSQFFGVLFFLSLVISGLTSLISLMEVVLAAVVDKFDMSRNKAIAIFGGISFVVSLLFATRGGMYLLDVVDNFINTFGILAAGLLEVVVLAWVLRKLDSYQEHANFYSQIKLGLTWKVSLGIITPIMLGFMLIQAFIENVRTPYGGYPANFVAIYGWGVVVAILLLSFVPQYKQWSAERVKQSEVLKQELDEVI